MRRDDIIIVNGSSVKTHKYANSSRSCVELRDLMALNKVPISIGFGYVGTDSNMHVVVPRQEGHILYRCAQ